VIKASPWRSHVLATLPRIFREWRRKRHRLPCLARHVLYLSYCYMCSTKKGHSMKISAYFSYGHPDTQSLSRRDWSSRWASLVILVTLGLPVAPTMAATWYVNSSASGANTGTSSNDAWRGAGDIQWPSLSPGDVLYWDYGTGENYGSVTIGASGNAASVAGRIWLVGTGVNRPLITEIPRTFHNYIGLVNFEITSYPSQSGIAIAWAGVTGWLVQDCFIHHKLAGLKTSNGDNNTKNILRGNVLQDLSSIAYQHQIQGQYNVIEYITMGRGGDRLRNFSHHLVYRNCYLTSMSKADLGGPDPHIDDMQTYRTSIEPPFWSDKCVVEAIFSRDSTTDNAHFLQIRDDVLSGDYRGLIARLNIIYNVGSLGENQNMANERGYNNTFVDLLTTGNISRWFRGPNVTAADNIWINNSFTRANANSESHSPLYVSAEASITAEHNHEYLSGNLQGANNIENTAPSFTDEGSLNFMPTISSPLRGAQRSMTTANGSGSGSATLRVDDADYFIDGWGIVEGDLIRIGAGDWVRITAINYVTEQITLAEARSWNDGDRAYLFGTEDAIGALPYRTDGYTLSGSIEKQGNTYVVVPNENTLCRMVIFYEDGVPQAPDYDAPYECTSNGGVVNAKLYARFASKNPVIAAGPPARRTAPHSRFGTTP